jgi:Zn-dependent peptidase ImmA (M78 family)/transcriptional regulator with XRE-family HTH domain
MNKVNPDMIVLARELRGVTQDELAAALGVTQATVSRYESGHIEVPPDHLRVMAGFLGRPESFFRWQERLYSASCMYHRQNRRLTAADVTMIHAKVNLLRIRAARLLRQARVTSKYTFHRLDPNKLGSTEECARRLRQLWQLPTGPVRNVVKVIERAGGMVHRCPFGEVRVDGISQWPLDDPDMPPIFFVHEDAPGDRERLTLAHEIGHIVMHHVVTEGDPEDEANRFAAEFLMPAREIGADLSNMTLPKAAAMKSYWKVSMQALIVHAHRLGKIDERTYKNLFIQMGRKGYRKCEPNPIPAEEPEMYRDVIGFHKTKLRWSVSQLGEFLGELEENYGAEYGLDFAGFRLVGGSDEPSFTGPGFSPRLALPG